MEDSEGSDIDDSFDSNSRLTCFCGIPRILQKIMSGKKRGFWDMAKDGSVSFFNPVFLLGLRYSEFLIYFLTFRIRRTARIGRSIRL